MHSPTGSEFEAFPPALKRKCFSTLERLRYAQAQAQTHAKAQALPVLNLNPSLHPDHRQRRRDLITHPRRSLSKARPSFSRRSSFHAGRQSKRFQAALPTADVSREDALWFSRLPDKVKRGQFSVEEQILLAGRQDTVILDAADEKLYKLRETNANRSLPSLESSYSERSSLRSFSSEESEDHADSAIEMDDSFMSEFRWLDESEPNLALDDYHTHVAEIVEPPQKSSSVHPSYRRHKSYASLSFSRSRPGSKSSKGLAERGGNGWAPTPVPDVPSLPSAARPTEESKPMPCLSPVQTSDAPSKLKEWGNGWAPTPAAAQRTSIDGTAEHYLNPEARLKLRLYLATPSKFDEALEFGFPSLQTPSQPRASTSSRGRSYTTGNGAVPRSKPFTFLDDSPTSDAYERDLTISTHSRPSSSGYGDSDLGPPTPHLVSPANSSYSQSGRSQGWSDVDKFDKDFERDPYLHAMPGREMTLRMTLTRPDLRADESVLYPDVQLHESVIRRMAGGRQVSGGGMTGGVKTSADLGPLSLEDLRLGEPGTVTTRVSSNGGSKEGSFRRLFSRKW